MGNPIFRCPWCGSTALQESRRWFWVIFHYPKCPCLGDPRVAEPVGLDATDAIEALGEWVADYNDIRHIAMLEP